MNSIPWILVAVLALVLLGIAIVIAVRRRKEPRRVDYRNYFVMGIIWLATGLVLLVLPWLLHGEVSFFPMSSFFLVMGLACAIMGLVNRDKWGKQVEMPPKTTKTVMIVTIVLVALLALGIVVFELLR